MITTIVRLFNVYSSEAYMEKSFFSLNDLCEWVNGNVKEAFQKKGDYIDYDLDDIKNFVVELETERFDTFNYTFEKILSTNYWEELESEVNGYILELMRYLRD